MNRAPPATQVDFSIAKTPIVEIMASLSSALRQASRLTARSSLATSTTLRQLQRPLRAAAAPSQARGYVSESRRDNAQIAEAKIETAIHLDRAQLQKAGLAIGAQQDGDVEVKPMAGSCALTPQNLRC